MTTFTPVAYVKFCEQDPQTIEAFITKHCRDNPLDDVADASQDLAEQLSHPK
jgi:hypothetical protein